jgi:hypothetical protein
VGNAQVVGTAEFGGKGAGEASVAVRIRFYGEQDLGVGGDLAPNKLNVVTEGVQVDFYPIRACNLI